MQKPIVTALRDRAELVQPEVWYDARSLVFGHPDAQLTAAQSSSFRRAANLLRARGEIEVKHVSREDTDGSSRFSDDTARKRWRLMVRLTLAPEDLAAAVAVHRRARVLRLARAIGTRPAVPGEDAWLAWYDSRYAKSAATYVDELELIQAGLWDDATPH